MEIPEIQDLRNQIVNAINSLISNMQLYALHGYVNVIDVTHAANQ